MSNRDHWIERLEYLGAKVKGSVSKNTDVVLVGQAPGSNKIEGAQKHGVPTLWFPFAEHCTLFDERPNNNLKALPKDFVSQLALQLTTMAEDLYVLSTQPGHGRCIAASIRATGTVRALLDGAYGQVISRDRADDEGVERTI